MKRWSDTTLPFASTFGPVARQRCRDLAEVDVLSVEAASDLEHGLVTRLSRLAAPALLDVFDPDRAEPDPRAPAGTERYWGFVASAGEALAAGHGPEEIGDLVAVVCDDWHDATIELVDRFVADHDAIVRDLGWAPGPIAGISRALGDSHEHGRSVLAITDGRGRKVVYKPRPTAPELAFSQIVASCNAHGADPELRVLAVVDRQTHGWVEFVEAHIAASPRDLADFYRRAGMLLGLAWLLGIRDLHGENLVASGADPVLVDLECIAQPRGAAHQGNPDPWGWAALEDSVLGCGLLPGRMPTAGPLAGDAAALTARPGSVTGAWGDGWADLGTDRIRRVRRLNEVPASASLPTRPGRSAPDVDVEAVASGFEQIHDLVRRHPVLLDGVARCRPRVLLRNTGVYAAAFHADDPATALGPLDPSCLEPGDPGREDRIVAAETAALARGDVPRFTIDPGTSDLYHGPARIGGPYVGPSLAAVRARMQSLGDGVRSLQSGVLRIALAEPTRRRTRPDTSPGDPTEAAVHIGDVIVGRVVRDDRCRPRWLDAAPTGQTLARTPDLSACGLYQGGSGVAVFLAMLSAATGRPAYGDVAREAVGGCIDRASGPDVRPDLAGGAAGIAYAGALVADLCADPVLLARAVDLADTVAVDIPDEHAALDLIGGPAGTLVALTAVARRAGTGRLDRAIASGALLLVDAIGRRDAATPTGRAHRRVGAAHGATGVALALARAGAHTEDERAIEAAVELVEDENARIRQRDGIPARTKPSRSDPRPDTGWCWGAAGHAVVRRRLAALLGSDGGVEAHVSAALDIVASAPPDNDRLCCGAAGRLDALADARHPAVRAEATRLAGAVLAGTGVFEPGLTFAPPSLFRGLAGTGASLLRSVDPRLPSVLGLD